jgi:hypothetical protein
MEDNSKFMVVCQIGGAGDPVIYRPGAVIRVPDDMAEEQALAHAQAGNLRPIDGTTLPAPAPIAPVVYEAPPPAPAKSHRRKADSPKERAE